MYDNPDVEQLYSLIFSLLALTNACKPGARIVGSPLFSISRRAETAEQLPAGWQQGGGQSNFNQVTGNKRIYSCHQGILETDDQSQPEQFRP